MSDRWTTIRVGIAVTGILIALVAGYLWLSKFQFAKERYYYKVRLTEASWLNKGDPVTILGVPKGRIDDIRLYPDSVIVVVWLEDYPLREGALARVESQGIIGQMRLSLTLGEGDTLPQWSTIPGYTQRDIGRVISDVGAFVTRSDSLLLTAGQLLIELQGLLTGAQSEFGQTLKELQLTLKQTRESLQSLQTFVAQEVSGLDSTRRVLHSAIAELDTMLHLATTGEGTVGKLINDPTLYHRLDSTLRALEELLKDVRAHPERYITIRLF